MPARRIVQTFSKLFRHKDPHIEQEFTQLYRLLTSNELNPIPIGGVILYHVPDNPSSSSEFPIPLPEGWKLCRGIALDIERYGKLYRVIGNTYGSTATTFNLPTLTALGSPTNMYYIMRVE